MAAKLRSFGSPVETRTYEGLAHIGIVLALAPMFRSRAPVREDVVNFVFRPPGG
jgi:hypothetical protein